MTRDDFEWLAFVLSIAGGIVLAIGLPVLLLAYLGKLLGL